MKCLILGANGFIGRNLVEMLLGQSEDELFLYDKDEIVYLKNKPQKNKWRYNTIKGEFCVDTDFVTLTKGMDIVYHLISTSLPNNSNENIGKGITDNVVATSLLLDACVKNDVQKVVFLSSGGTVYGIAAQVPLGENAINNPITGYGLQKFTIEKMLYLYWHLYGLDYRIIRLSNPYGKYQKPNGIQGVVTTFIYRVMCEEDLHVFGDGFVIRDYIYIEDAIIAIQKVVSYQGEYKLFNIGSGKGYSINEIINIIEKTVGKKANVVYSANRKADVPINILDIKRYKSCFGEIVRVNLEEGINRTYQYFKNNFRK